MAKPPVPLMLVHGDHDDFLPLEKVAEMKKAFPQVQYELIPETGHNSFIEQTAMCVEAILRFA